MVSPLFPSLTPRYIDEHWFHYDQLFEEDRTLSGLEKEYHNLISEIENRAYNNSQDTTNVYSDADDDDDDDGDDDDGDDDDGDDDDGDDDDGDDDDGDDDMDNNDDDDVDDSEDSDDNDDEFEDDIFNVYIQANHI
ncbi:hypothetical protein DERF_016029 [Dermatophagoides farinae]|uniref:Uncharacterized protein n=1 Tax=Dermatophagoides farinae TaxID=6954 RepID=A0A922HL23_DERFA|nr:hypothetical protein DERF_016029 [Dermatophagoides farinae]